MINTFEITSADGLAHGLLILVLCLFLGLLVVFLKVYIQSANQSVSLSQSDLTLKVPIFGRVIPISDLMVSQARLADLSVDQELKAKRRTAGIGLPGFKVGWYKLFSGEKALLAVVNSDHAVYIPTTKGYSLLISLKNPQDFLSSLRDFTSVSLDAPEE
ncbi:MAG: hypothetical protein ISR87_13320 [Candidatus Marinimicrobia bacterium]|nr:hypothetical protein [FCB group bacterium]MBL7026422.1 hypothetical protein [Candidatus Neomarinimicrobiota bacterium]